MLNELLRKKKPQFFFYYTNKCDSIEFLLIRVLTKNTGGTITRLQAV